MNNAGTQHRCQMRFPNQCFFFSSFWPCIPVQIVILSRYLAKTGTFQVRLVMSKENVCSTLLPIYTYQHGTTQVNVQKRFINCCLQNLSRTYYSIVKYIRYMIFNKIFHYLILINQLVQVVQITVLVISEISQGFLPWSSLTLCVNSIKIEMLCRQGFFALLTPYFPLQTLYTSTYLLLQSYILHSRS